MQQAAKKVITSEQARKLVPLAKLTTEDTEELLRTAITSRLSAGTPVFRSNDLPKQVFYLLVGEVELITRDKGRRIIKSGTSEARKPLGRGITGQLSATALKDSLIISFDADMLELFLSWTNPEAYLVSEMNTSRSSEWLDKLLQSRGLLRFSEEHIQSLLDRMSEVHHNAGDVIIQQDAEDDYYYIIKNGRCSVTRQASPDDKVIKLAELRAGDAFGEEALLANAPRSANIVMEEDGDLMRLSKDDFSKLLAKPLLNTVSWDNTHNLIRLGAAFLDIRLPDEFARRHIPGSINIPLALLRLRIKQLSHHRKYIICCGDGSRSAVAAFLLNRHGFDAFILDGGLAASQPLLEQESGDPVPSVTEAAAIGSVTSPVADQWGGAGDEPLQPSFEDAPDIATINKTQPVSPTTKPVNAASPIPSSITDTAMESDIGTGSSAAKIHRPHTELIIDQITSSAKEHKQKRRLVRSAIAFAVIALVSAIPAIFSLGWINGGTTVTPAAVSQTDKGEFLRPANSPAALKSKPALAKMTMGELTPWNDSADNQVTTMVESSAPDAIPAAGQ